MAAFSDRSVVTARLGSGVVRGLLDWAELNDLSVDLSLPSWSPPGRGYTGALLEALEVAPPARVVILKVLPAGPYRGEPGRHTRALRTSPPDFAEKHLVELPFAPYPLEGGGALMFQGVAGDGLRDMAPIRVLGGDDFALACIDVVRGLLTEWNTTSRRPRRMRASAFLQWELRAAWSGGASLEQARERAGLSGSDVPWFEAGGRRLPNPFLLVTGGHSEFDDPEVSVLTGLTHGDLHLDNVLVPRRRGVLLPQEYRLIDLCSFTSDGALTRDVAMLLLSALVPVLQEPLSARQELLLLDYVVRPQEAHLSDLPHGAAARVDCVRDTAAGLMGGWREPWADQLLLSLVAGALAFTTFTSLGPGVRQWYLRLAAHAGGELLESRAFPYAKQSSVAGGPPAPSAALRGEEPAADESTAIRPIAAEVRRTGGHLDSGQRRALVLALEAVPAMADPGSRAVVLRMLPPEVATSIPRSPITRVELLGVVETCLAFPEGLAELWEAISTVDAGTRSLEVLHGVLERMSVFRGVTENGHG
ncbi:effector-associated domain 2-containing protein [Streptomyces sp. NPDC054766]